MRKAEHGAVDEGDAERGIGSGRDHVALFDVVAVVEGDRNAVAGRGRAARQLGDMADGDVSGSRTAVGLAILDVAGERADDIAGEMGAIGRGQRRVLLALEVVLQDQLLVVVGKDQVDAGSLEIAVEQQMRVRNDDRIRWRVGGH